MRPKDKRPVYRYMRRGPLWVVFRLRRSGDLEEGDKIAEFFSREEAEAMVYRLNGWDRKEEEDNNNETTYQKIEREW